MITGNKRPHFGFGIIARADFKRFDARYQLLQQAIRGILADRYHYGNRHAALSRRAVDRADNGIDRLLKIGIGHDHHMIFGAAKRLHAFAVGAAGFINVFTNGC